MLYSTIFRILCTERNDMASFTVSVATILFQKFNEVCWKAKLSIGMQLQT